MCIIASISANECFSAVTAIGYLQGIPQIFFLNFNLWGLAVPVKDSYIPHPRAFQFLSWKKLNFFSVIWNLLLCKTLLLQSKISGTPNLIQYLPVFAAILFCLHPYKTFSPCSRNWQPQREAVSTVLSCRRNKSCAFYMQPCLLQLMTLC